MIWLVILLSVIIILALLLALMIAFGHASIRVIYTQRLKVVARIVGIPFTLYSDKPKKEKKKRDLSTCHNPRAVLRRELRRQRRAAKKAYRKQLKAEKKARANAQKKAAGKLIKPNLLENLQMIASLIKIVYAETRGRLTLNVYSLRITVGTDDAAKTALLYGAVLPVVTGICQLIESHYQHIERKDGDMVVLADYVGGKCSAEVDFRFRVTVLDGIRIALRLFKAYRKEKAAAHKKARARVRANRAA